MSVLYILLAILLLAILIVVHEFGHFMAARLMKIDVNEFSVGFGPKLLGWKSRKYETVFSIRAIPLGGYCSFYGEDDTKGITKDDPRAFSNQNVWKRMFVILMGPMMNFVLALVVAMGYMWFIYGEPEQINLHLQDTVADSPAAAAGLQKDDLITAIDGKTIIYDPESSSLISDWKVGDDPVRMTVERDGETLEVSLMPEWNEKANKPQIGIVYNGEVVTTRPLGFGEGITEAWDLCVSAGGAVIEGLRALVTKPAEVLPQTSGPVGIVQVVSDVTKTDGVSGYIWLMILISVNLGLMNLLPIPGLDGSRLVFGLIEVVRRKPVPPEKEAMVHLAGMVLLFGFVIFITMKDIGLIQF